MQRKSNVWGIVALVAVLSVIGTGFAVATSDNVADAAGIDNEPFASELVDDSGFTGLQIGPRPNKCKPRSSCEQHSDCGTGTCVGLEGAKRCFCRE